MNTHSKRRGSLFMLVILVAVLILVLTTQQAVAGAIGGWFAGVWIGTMDIVLRLIGAVLPG